MKSIYFFCVGKAKNLISINLEKSRQTSAIISSGKTTKFNNDFTN